VHEHWIVDLALDRLLSRGAGEPLDREAFLEWLWAECGDALVGIDQGWVDVEEAAARGLAATSRVIDAAAAPADRDWLRDAASQQVSCWFTTAVAARETAARLADIVGCRVDGIRHHTAAETPDWRHAFSPIEVPGFGTVCPAWADGVAAATTAGVRMFIEPGMGFGTGLHETTQLCLQALVEWRAGGGSLDRVLDFGSGSGILGIAAALLGARHVDAVEIDAPVHAAIRANANRNGVGARVQIASALPAGGEPYDVVIANIVAPVLVEHADALCGLLRRGRGTCLLLSGLLADDVPAVTGRYAAACGPPATVARAGDWCRLQFIAG